MARDTTTGGGFEAVIKAALIRAGCAVTEQSVIGVKPGGGRHRIDFLAERQDGTGRAIVSVKVQNTGGTAEEKLAYEVIKLIHALDENPSLTHAYLVLGGTGWSQGMRTFITCRVVDYVPHAAAVQVMGTDEFLTHVNRRQLFAAAA